MFLGCFCLFPFLSFFFFTFSHIFIHSPKHATLFYFFKIFPHLYSVPGTMPHVTASNDEAGAELEITKRIISREHNCLLAEQCLRA